MSASIHHGMEALQDLEIFKVSFKCVKCKFYGQHEEQVASHYKLKHHGGFACRRGEYLVQYPENDTPISVVLGGSESSYKIIDCLVEESDDDNLEDCDLVLGTALVVSRSFASLH